MAWDISGLMLGNPMFEHIGVAKVITAVGAAEHIGVERHVLVLRYAISTSLNGYSGRTEVGKGE
jgi:hypothetical protein